MEMNFRTLEDLLQHTADLSQTLQLITSSTNMSKQKSQLHISQQKTQRVESIICVYTQEGKWQKPAGYVIYRHSTLTIKIIFISDISNKQESDGKITLITMSLFRNKNYQ